MWNFLSRGRGETEGFSNGSMAEFKGNPLQALAREVCQNSLDATDGSDKPVIVEFEKIFMPINDFPGMKSLREVIKSCDQFWSGKGDVNTMNFLRDANKCLDATTGKFFVLRVSDYNTKGVKGSFSNDDITPWGSLVKGNAFSVKDDVKNAAGSYGIGKAAPFVSSRFQTVFYRTLDFEGVNAALGVARLMAHNSIAPVQPDEDIVRRSVGYYGADKNGFPSHKIDALDKINKRTTCGTDLFIPGFTGSSTGDEWIKEILKEIVDNFLYSIYSGKLEIRIENRTLSKKNLGQMLDYIGSKDAKIFYEAIRYNSNVQEATRDFHKLGTLRLRLLYGNDLNKKILVVRNSGMKIAKINSLPRTISYTGFLSLEGSDLNQFFREMENPSHNAWEPKRHSDSKRAKQYKEEVEQWVVDKITEKLIEISGEESLVDIGDCFNFLENDDKNSPRKKEAISNDAEDINTEVYIPQKPSGGKISIRDEGKAGKSRKARGIDDPNGSLSGHRHRTGKKKGLTATGRKVSEDPSGQDTAYIGDGDNPREIPVRARIISRGNGENKLVFTADSEITLGRIEIVTVGENGKSMPLIISSVRGNNAYLENGRIVVKNVPAATKQTIEFELIEKHNYAMGVKAYENKK